MLSSIFNPLNGNFDKIGELKGDYTHLMSNGQMMSANAWYSAGKLTLIPGTWLVIGQINIMTVPNVDAMLYQRIINGDASIVYATDAIYTYQTNKQLVTIINTDIARDIFIQAYASSPAGVYANAMVAIKFK